MKEGRKIRASNHYEGSQALGNLVTNCLRGASKGSLQVAIMKEIIHKL